MTKKINVKKLFNDFVAMAESEEHFFAEYERAKSAGDVDAMYRANFFLGERRKALKAHQEYMESLGYPAMKVWEWYQGKDVQW